jgi:hypothetical protein
VGHLPPPVTGTPPSARAGHSAILTASDKVVVFGGVSDSGKHLNDVHVLSTQMWNWYKPAPTCNSENLDSQNPCTPSCASRLSISLTSL